MHFVLSALILSIKQNDISHFPASSNTAIHVRASFRTENKVGRMDSAHHLDPLFLVFWNKLFPSPNIKWKSIQETLI